MTTTGEPISFRAVTRADLKRLMDWHARPHVLEWWSEPPSEAELDGYIEEQSTSFYVALLGSEPFGFVQCYRPVDGHSEGWWLDEHDPGVRGIDLFLANADQLGRGLGARMIRAFVAMLFADPAVTRIQADPDPGNARAMRCYEKAGFRRAKEVATPDGFALLMYCDRAAP